MKITLKIRSVKNQIHQTERWIEKFNERIGQYQDEYLISIRLGKIKKLTRLEQKLDDLLVIKSYMGKNKSSYNPFTVSAIVKDTFRGDIIMEDCLPDYYNTLY